MNVNMKYESSARRRRNVRLVLCRLEVGGHVTAALVLICMAIPIATHPYLLEKLPDHENG
jgi:hypothetical protein